MRGCGTIVAVAFAVGVGVPTHAADGWCARLETAADLQATPIYGRHDRAIRDDARSPGGPERLRILAATSMRQLDDADARVRVRAVIELHVARTELGQRFPDYPAYVSRRLAERARMEPDGSVVLAIVRALADDPVADDLAPLLAEILPCPEDADLRHAALSAALRAADPALVTPLLAVWDDDPGTIDATSVLHNLTRLLDDPASAAATGTTRQALGRRLVRTYRPRHPPGTHLPLERYQPFAMLERLADLGGPDAEDYLAAVFDAAGDADRARLAPLVLRAQIEPGKPPWDGSNATHPLSCTTRDDYRRTRQPWTDTEVARLLRDRNARYFARIDTRGMERLGSLYEWSALRFDDPPARVAHWRRVVALLGDDWLVRQVRPSVAPLEQLARALASRAATTIDADPAAARRDIDEALAITDTIESPYPPVREAVHELADTLARRGRPVSTLPLASLAGTYGTTSALFGRGGQTLTLTPDGRFAHEVTQSCLILPSCPDLDRANRGTYRIEDGYLLLEPGYRMGAAGILAPDALRLIEDEGRVIALARDQLDALCDSRDDPRREHGILRSTDRVAPEGLPSVSEVCQHRARTLSAAPRPAHSSLGQISCNR